MFEYFAKSCQENSSLKSDSIKCTLREDQYAFPRIWLFVQHGVVIEKLTVADTGVVFHFKWPKCVRLEF